MAIIILAGISAGAVSTALEVWQLKKREMWTKITGCILILFNLIVFIPGIWLMVQYGYHPLKIIRYVVLLEGLIFIAIEDKKYRIISNRILASLALIRIILLIGEIACFPSYWNLILWSSFIGFAVGGGIFLLAFLLSRGGIGMGDVKLMAVQGFYLGSQTMVSSLVLTMVLTIIAGLGLVAVKKVSLKAELPFGPFVAAGTAVTLLMGF